MLGKYFYELQSVRSTIEGRFDLSVKIALIAEGSGQRGIFTAGVLDTLLEDDFYPLDLFIGTPSGSQNIMSFLSRQKRFYKLGRGLVGGNVVDLDWYFDKTIQARFALDFAEAKELLAKRELLFITTDSRDRQGYFCAQTAIVIIGEYCLKFECITFFM
jgi:predicted patatin/cPLA2 family phospholipase